LTKIDAIQTIRNACEQGIDFAEIDQRLAAAGLSIPEMVDAYREAAKRDFAEADALERFGAERFG
jgi:hypothetical protein